MQVEIALARAESALRKLVGSWGLFQYPIALGLAVCGVIIALSNVPENQTLRASRGKRQKLTMGGGPGLNR